jgi:bifunctional non-homologous end joining protein LigD
VSLVEYKRKRKFTQTPEPEGQLKPRKAKALSFVIQKHDATRLHYDFRLEMEGVLKSWAVPKGVPTNKGEKRLAMHVEDHPLDYGGFEGTIPEGNYGAGTVMLWDRGTYEAVTGDPLDGYRAGKLHIRMHGEKLAGEWTLVRMRSEGGKEPWLLIKSGEDMKPLSAKRDDESVVSGKSMQQIAAGRGRVWQSNRQTTTRRSSVKVRPKPSTTTVKRASNPLPELKTLPREPAKFVPPMKALLVRNAPPRDGWSFEIKWDGYRAVAVKANGRVRLFSRRHREITHDFEAVAHAVESTPHKNLVLDGEIVALDENGRPSFQLLQNFRQPSARPGQRLIYYVFDLLNYENRDLKKLPLEQRRRVLESVLGDTEDPIRLSGTLEGDPEDLVEQARKNSIEGLIAKRVSSIYEPDRRSGSWLKVKTVMEQEFVIGGYTEPKGSRAHFGALLVGYYEGAHLLFASKVGTGFNHDSLHSLYQRFQKLTTSVCPFVNLPTKGPNGLSRAEMRRCTWLLPALVCQVRFTEWTGDGGLRHPVFLGLRDDKRPNEVHREIPA